MSRLNISNKIIWWLHWTQIVMCRIVSVLGCEIEKYLLDNVKKCDKNHKNLWFYLHLFCGAAKKDLIMMLQPSPSHHQPGPTHISCPGSAPLYRDSHLFTQNNFDFVKARNVCRWNIEDCKYFVWVMTAGSRPLWHCHASTRVWHDHNPWPGVRSPPLYYPFINSFVGIHAYFHW